MPEYEFYCNKCNLPLSLWHGMDAVHPTIHEGCGGRLKRKFVAIPVHYTHSGFYSTDKVLDEPEQD